MAYVIITAGSLSWFLLSLFTTMLLLTALVTPKWLIGAETYQHPEYNFTVNRNPSVGIYTRCMIMSSPYRYNCGTFDQEGFATNSAFYPAPWKAAMFFQSAAVTVMTLTIVCTMITCCRQSVLGKSIHSCTSSAQAIAGICAMIAIFCHMLGWGAPRVLRLCGPDAEPFYPGECRIGLSMYCAVIGVVLSFCCAGVSLKAESSNMRTRVIRRVEGGERLVIVA